VCVFACLVCVLIVRLVLCVCVVSACINVCVCVCLSCVKCVLNGGGVVFAIGYVCAFSVVYLCVHV
jgi:hypothetical protein